jgi:hypothetical protein
MFVIADFYILLFDLNNNIKLKERIEKVKYVR